MGLPRAMRLRKSRDIQRVQRLGRRVRLPHLLFLYLPGEPGQSRVGLTVSRKVGNAVVRNRVKRWLREAVRAHRGDIPDGFDLVMIAHPQAADAGLAVLTNDVRDGLNQLQKVA